MVWRVRNLLTKRCPAAVVRFVVTVAVNAINAMFRARPPAHVGKEILKGVFPAIADFDASSAIAIPVFSPGIGTSRFHGAPTLVFGRRRAAVLCMAMFSCAVELEAAAGPMLVRSEIVSANLPNDFAAIAVAPPCGLPVKRAVAIQNQEPGEPFTCNVDQCWHDTGIIMLSAIGSQENRR